jgi:Xaa-Pro dipeptidase
MKTHVPLAELKTRMDRFRARMESASPDWGMTVVFSKVNLYYFTGTMQDGLLLIPRHDEAVFWVRRSYERALDESLFPRIKPMESFREAAASFKKLPATVFLETESVPLALYERFRKHFPFANVRSADAQIGAVRAVKSPFELSAVERAGKIHRLILEERVPQILREGMSEADLGVELFSILMAEGHHGVVRFGMFDTEIMLGHINFGESSLHPSYFNGAGGNRGLSMAVPLLGSRERRLERGDLIYIDLGCGIDGYHTDKTMTYMFGQAPSDEVLAVHGRCVEIQDEIASLLKPDAIPSQIYTTIMQNLDAGFQNNFMGFGNRRVKFLGHGIGLWVDEWPAIAEGFDEPLQEGMVLAVEPKKGIQDVGMVGIENTFLVTAQGGRSLTGESRGLIPIF